MLQKNDFYYELPESLIAQTPLTERDRSRLMVLDRKTGAIEHRHFYEIGSLLRPGDCLILNDTRVLPARLYGEKTGTGTRVEFLLLSQQETYVWEALAGPGRRAKPGTRFSFGGGLLHCEVVQTLAGGNRLLQFEPVDNFRQVLEQVGEMPLPHYIRERLHDRERYQTVYARTPGSAAAPTAGLHFTPPLLAQLQEQGIAVGFVTLHVGLGTFRPVQADNIREHVMHAEHYQMTRDTADLIRHTKKTGGRVIAVGTTACRTLESVAARFGRLCEAEGTTDIFIYPGYEFKVLDGLVTNFHLPESTLIMLVSAFAGHENTMKAYQCAVEEQYRFFSFGDAMLIL